MEGIELARWAVPAAAILASAAVSGWYQRYRGLHTAAILWKVIAGGLLAARLAFVVQNADTYASAPLSILDIRDGGFSGTAGLFVAFVLGAELTRRTGSARRPVLAAALAGAAVWIGGSIATLDFAPARTLVPLVEVRRLDGRPVQLRTLTRQPMVVNLWATWCPPCRREMPALRDAQQRFPGVTFAFVNQGEDAAAIGRFLAQQELELENVFTDRASEVGRRTGSLALPTTLFFDRQGRLFMRHVGELDRAALDKRLRMLEASD